MPELNRAILRLLPEPGTAVDAVTTPALHKRLADAYPDEIVVKTVQRRLEKLEAQGRAPGWRNGEAN